MRRRDLLVGGSITLAQLWAAKSRADCGVPNTRAAVSIGVNKAGTLPVLKAAISGAKSVADWLCGEGFEVKLIVDVAGPVTARMIKDAVFELVGRSTLTHLVIYFSGHGVCVGFNEYWLLSGAPDDPNEAVTLRESWELAHRSGIPNVVFISDACRSIPEYNASLLTGTLIFPNSPTPAGRSGKVDRFLATEPGQSSIEAKVAADAYAGIYTAVFLEAFQHPSEEMVKTIDGNLVVPNSILEDYLRVQVPLRLMQIDLKHRQIPDTRLECRDNFYIGRALRPASPPGPGAVFGEQNAKISDVVNRELATTQVGTLGPLHNIYEQTLKQVATESGFDHAKASISTAKGARSFETEMGLAINGARVIRAMSRNDVEILRRYEDPALVRVYPGDGRPATVALMFEDGSGTVIAALPGFVGTITVAAGKVSSVTYAPSVGGSRSYGSYDEKERLDKLHALVGAAAKYGAFRIEGNEESRARAAERLADQIRVMKGVDPTLGIYAAYAYADANLIDQVQSVREFMRGDLRGDLFDVALLANALSGKHIENPDGVTPICPMLSQGWQLLRVKNVVLPKPIEQARSELRDGLWTTFGPKGMELVFSYMQQNGFRNSG
ncbi:caspase family protein [Bradyrhizobium sp. NBAIM01]|uniref:caspase family protein n=1 Tax=Bradyrhizobium sp. NBAIM01 TaxID=2793818 RepID=UPI001CD66D3A|nr:caspase family protein [Bradyrhizobium sp. NBAIM01]MCA1515630.1 caspase family protein [Bradyrhizobium sp. NBAIM01]